RSSATPLTPLGRVVRVDAHVAVAEVAAPGVPRRLPGAEVDLEVDAVGTEDAADGVEIGVDGAARVEDGAPADRHPAAVEHELGAAAPHRRNDAPPVGIAAVDRGLHQRAPGHGAGREPRLDDVHGAANLDPEVTGRALAV